MNAAENGPRRADAGRRTDHRCGPTRPADGDGATAHEEDSRDTADALGAGLSVREVAQSPGVSVGVISKAVQRAKNAELDWVAAGALSEAEIEVRRSCLPALRGG